MATWRKRKIITYKCKHLSTNLSMHFLNCALIAHFSETCRFSPWPPNQLQILLFIIQDLIWSLNIVAPFKVPLVYSLQILKALAKLDYSRFPHITSSFYCQPVSHMLCSDWNKFTPTSFSVYIQLVFWDIPEISICLWGFLRFLILYHRTWFLYHIL